MATLGSVSWRVGMLGLHITEYPNGKFGFVGSVPVELAYIDATPELLAAAKFGARFGPKTRTFITRQEAIDFAASQGYTPEEE